MKNLVCLSKLIMAGTMRRANAKSAYLIAILLTLVSLATPVSSYEGDSLMGTVHGTVSVTGPDGQSYSASGAKVRLIGTSLNASLVVLADDSGEYKFGSVPPGSYKLEVALDGFENVARPITIHAGETTVEDVRLEPKNVRNVLTNLHAPEYRKFTQSFGGSHFSNAAITNNTFKGNSGGYFASARNAAVHSPRFFSLEMQVLKSYRLKVRPKVSLRNRFYPRDSQGSLGGANSGMFSNGVSRMLGMRLVIEKE
jgi:hypothetical protein